MRVSPVPPRGGSGSAKIGKVLTWCEPGSNRRTAQHCATKFMKNTITVQVNFNSWGKFNRSSYLSTIISAHPVLSTEHVGNRSEGFQFYNTVSHGIQRKAEMYTPVASRQLSSIFSHPVPYRATMAADSIFMLLGIRSL